MRKCTKCRHRLPLAAFGKSRNGPGGLNYWCKNCVRANTETYRRRLKDELGEVGFLEKRRLYYTANRDAIQAKRTAQQNLRREHFTAQATIWRKAHPDIVRATKKKSRAKYLEKIIAYTREYHATHKPQRNAHIRERKARDPAFKLRECLRSSFADRLRTALKAELSAATCRRYSVIKLVGCTMPELMKYLEARFQPGMSWSNWGRGRGRWHIDHVRPVASFVLSRHEDLGACWHYTNLQPLWELDNIRKSDNWEPAQTQDGANQRRQGTLRAPAP